jgi:hypothetical protein
LSTNFLQFDPAGTSGISNSGNCFGSCDNKHNDIVSEQVTATFHFTMPSGDTTASTVTGEFYANYDGPLDGTQGGTNPVNCGDSGNPADCIVWNNNDPFTATFANGDVLTVDLLNQHDWDITSTATFSVAVSAPAPVIGHGIWATFMVGAVLLSQRLFGRRRRVDPNGYATT